ncbi:MAG TPA: lysozyme inhibitor LprI family protein [Ignavibacteria bacterium]
MSKYILFLLLLVLTLPAKIISQEKEHPIDVIMDSCMEKDPSTFGSIKCVEEASKLWDAEIEKYNKLLLGILDAESVKIYKSAQAEWLIYKEKELANIDRIYSQIQGTMFLQIAAGEKLDIVKQRALQLQSYYDDLEKN